MLLNSVVRVFTECNACSAVSWIRLALQPAGPWRSSRIACRALPRILPIFALMDIRGTAICQRNRTHAQTLQACHYLNSWRSGIFKKSRQVVFVLWMRVGFFSTIFGCFKVLSEPTDAVCNCCVVSLRLPFALFACWHASAWIWHVAHVADWGQTWLDVRSCICCLRAACLFALFSLVSRRLWINKPLFDIVITVDFRVLVIIHY